MMLAVARRVWSDLRAGFWFLPSVLLGAHVGLAILLTSTELGRNKPWMAEWPNLFGAGADGARGMLSTIAGSMMTVVGVTLSMTLVTLALASSQYTSRILRNFIGDRITQFVLGLFAGVYCYCIIVLRTIRGGDEGGFVPGLAVLVGVLLAVLGIIVLIYFIHHIATSIQASNIIASVAAETIAAVDRLYPADAEPVVADEPWSVEDPPPRWKPVMAAADGYIERIDFDRLQEIAELHRTTVRIERAIGEFVIEGAPLASVVDGAPERVKLEEAVSGTIEIGRHRTVEQDVGFGIRQLVDIALRALSPGINDTTTAVMCIDYLTAILTRLSTRAISGPQHRPERVLNAHPPTFDVFLAEAFDQIREAGRGNFAVLHRLLDSLDSIGSMPIAPARREAMLGHVDLLDETVASSIEGTRDRELLGGMAERIRARFVLH